MNRGPKPIPFETRFLAKVDKSNPDACWIWTGAKDPNGYGRFAIVHGVARLAHRVSFEIANGEMPEGMVLDHKCHNPACVNPDHLRLCTQKENCQNLKWNSRNSTGFKGVYRNGSKWMAQININGKSTYLGQFATPEDAHNAYCVAADKVFGEFANYGEKTA